MDHSVTCCNYTNACLYPYVFTRWRLPNSGCRHLIAAYYSFIYHERMKGRVGLVGWPTADSLPTEMVTRQLQVERRTGKVCRSKTNILHQQIYIRRILIYKIHIRQKWISAGSVRSLALTFIMTTTHIILQLLLLLLWLRYKYDGGIDVQPERVVHWQRSLQQTGLVWLVTLVTGWLEDRRTSSLHTRQSHLHTVLSSVIIIIRIT